MINYFTKKHAASLFLLVLCIGFFLGKVNGQVTATITYTEGNVTAPAVSNSDLLQSAATLSASSGSFGNEGSGGLLMLTNGNAANGIANRAGISTGSSITYTLNTMVNTAGYTITEINVFSAWGDNGRLTPNVTVSYAFASDPANFISLGTTAFTPTVGFPDPWTKSVFTIGGGTILSGVVAVKFDFGTQQNGFVGYTELDVLGTPTGSSGPDIIAPTVPANLVAGNIASNAVSLSWTASTDNFGVTGYDVYAGATLVGSPATSSFTVTNLLPLTAYTFTVKAKDGAGNTSDASSPLLVTTIAGPIFSIVYTEGNATAPSVLNDDLLQTAATLAASSGNFTNEGSAGVVTLINGNASSGSSNMAAISNNSSLTYALNTATNSAGYDISAINIYSGWGDNGRLIPNVKVLYSLVADPATFITLGTATFNPVSGSPNPWTKSSFTANGAIIASGVAALKFDFGVQQNDYVGYSEIDVVGVPAYVVPDNTAPTIPGNLTSGVITYNSVVLNWNASTDNVGVIAYDVYQGALLVGSPATNAFTVNGLSASTAYSFTVVAKDAAGNRSAASDPLAITTAAPPPPGVINIDKNMQYQRIDGFGAFGGKDVAWSSNPFYDDNFNNLVVNDLGSNIVRIEVSNTLEMVNDNSSPDITDSSRFSITANATNSCDGSGGPMSRWLDYLKAIKQKADDNGEPLKVIASFWTPPVWMKYIECQFGTDNTWNRLSNGVGPLPGVAGAKADMRYEFAEFCAVYVKMFKKNTGFDLFAISLQNEPAFAQPYQSCVYSPEQLADIIKIVGNRFKQEGITIKIFGPEDVQSQDRMLTYLNAIGQDVTARDNMNIAAIHGYGNDGVSSSAGTVSNWKQTYATAQKYNWPLWMTETSGYSQDWTPTGAINLAKSIHLALKYGKISGWVYWQLSEPGGTTFSLLNAGQHSPLSYISKNYYRYIRPGAVQVESNAPNDEIGVTAFLHHANKTLTVELLNDGAEAKAYTLNISGGNIPANFTSYRTSSTENCINTGVIASSAIIVLPPQSVTTLVGTTVLADAPLPVSILSHPRDTTVNPGDLVIFSVVATGTPGLAYQWSRNNVIITGATAPTYQVVATNADNGAIFTVVVSNAYGAPVTSNNAILSLNSFAGLSIPFIASEPVIDGVQDNVWNSIPFTQMTKKVIGNPDPAVFSGSFKAAWDNTNLYLLYNVTDIALVNAEDDVEFFFNGLNDKPSGYGALDYQYRFIYNNAPLQETKHNKVQGVVYQQVAVSGGYITEVKIPWATLGVVPAAGKLLGMDFAADNTNVLATGRIAKIAWNTTNNDIWYNPSYMGTGMLVAGALPVQLLNFKASRSGNSSLLTWSTVTESNNKGFYIEHSSDGLHFNTGAFVNSKANNGNSSSLINYQLLHQQTVKGLNFYRLKQVDRDGKTTYSNIVKVLFSSNGFNVLNVTPNPVAANQPLKVMVASAGNDEVSLQVMDATGRLLVQNFVKVQPGTNSFNLNTKTLPAGFYYLKISGNNIYENATQRFVIE